MPALKFKYCVSFERTESLVQPRWVKKGRIIDHNLDKKTCVNEKKGGIATLHHFLWLPTIRRLCVISVRNLCCLHSFAAEFWPKPIEFLFDIY